MDEAGTNAFKSDDLPGEYSNRSTLNMLTEFKIFLVSMV
jgi:hypothetical protein